jgi:hypothetical protein
MAVLSIRAPFTQSDAGISRFSCRICLIDVGAASTKAIMAAVIARFNNIFGSDDVTRGYRPKMEDRSLLYGAHRRTSRQDCDMACRYEMVVPSELFYDQGSSRVDANFMMHEDSFHKKVH